MIDQIENFLLLAYLLLLFLHYNFDSKWKNSRLAVASQFTSIPVVLYDKSISKPAVTFSLYYLKIKKWKKLRIY